MDTHVIRSHYNAADWRELQGLIRRMNSNQRNQMCSQLGLAADMDSEQCLNAVLKERWDRVLPAVHGTLGY